MKEEQQGFDEVVIYSSPTFAVWSAVADMFVFNQNVIHVYSRKS